MCARTKRARTHAHRGKWEGKRQCTKRAHTHTERERERERKGGGEQSSGVMLFVFLCRCFLFICFVSFIMMFVLYGVVLGFVLWFRRSGFAMFVQFVDCFYKALRQCDTLIWRSSIKPLACSSQSSLTPETRNVRTMKPFPHTVKGQLTPGVK